MEEEKQVDYTLVVGKGFITVEYLDAKIRLGIETEEGSFGITANKDGVWRVWRFRREPYSILDTPIVDIEATGKGLNSLITFLTQ